MSKLDNYLILAEGFLSINDYSRALDAFKRAYEFSESIDEKTDILFEIADIYMINEDYTSARDTYLKIISMEKLSGAYFGLAIVNDALDGDVDESIILYKLAIELSPDYDRAYYYLGHSYDKINRRDLALKCFLKTARLEPEDYVVLNDIGSIYEEEKNYSLAREYVERSLSINPNYGRALYNMGVILKAMGDSDLALEYYKKSTKVWDYHLNYLNMSAIYIERKDYISAREILNEGIVHAPSVNLFYNRACVNVYENKIESAIEDLARAIEYNSEAYYWAKEDIDLMEVVKLYDNYKDRR